MAVIRPARVADYPVLLERLFASFADGWPGHPFFDEIYPDAIVPTAECMAQFLVAEEAGEIVAGLQVVPRPMQVAGCVRLNVGGLGQVFCRPPCRKHGHMSALLRACISRMDADGRALSLLGGDRLRYGRYGWETAGAQRLLHLSARNLDAAAPTQSAAEFWQPRRWRPGDPDTARMAAAYRALPYHGERTDAEFAQVLQRPGTVTWVAAAADGLAYACLQGNRLVEYAGALTVFRRLLGFLVPRMALQAPVPPTDGESELEQLLVRAAGYYGIEVLGMVRVNSLRAVLAAYAPLLARRLAGWRGSCALRVTDGAEERVTLSGEGRGVPTLGDGPAAVELALPRTDWARLLFGPFAPAGLGALEDHELLRRAFPLPLFWHPLSHV